MNQSIQNTQNKNTTLSEGLVDEKSFLNLGATLLIEAYDDNSSEFPTVVLSVLSKYLKYDANSYIDKIVRIGLHLTAKTYSGFNAYLFNYLVRSSTKWHNDDFIKSLCQWNLEDFLPEVYQSKSLSLDEKTKLQEQQHREFQSLRNAFIKSLIQNDKSTRFFGDSQDTQFDDLYSQCYNQICIQENLGKQQNYSSPPLYYLFNDYPCYGQIFWTYCLPTKELLISLEKDEINPLSRKRYSPETQRKLRQIFSTELKLIRYTLDKINLWSF